MSSKDLKDKAKNPNFKYTLGERLLSKLSPKLAVRHYRDRVAYEMVGNSASIMEQGYITNQSKKRSMRGWNASANSVHEDTLPKVDGMRATSRDLYMNSAIGRSVIKRHRMNALGTGLRLESQIDREVLGFEENSEEAKTWERNTEREWKSWANSHFSDAELTLNVDENGVLAFTNMLLSGDSFVPLLGYSLPGQVYNTKVKVVEADYIKNPDNLFPTYKLAGGVEVNGMGAPIAYHFAKFRQHDSIDLGVESASLSERIPRFNDAGLQQILHLFIKERPGQRRGVPILAPVIEDIKEITRYKGAEVDAAILNSFYTVFIKSVNNIAGDQMGEGYFPTAGGGVAPLPGESVKTDENDPKENVLYEMGKANIIEMDENQSIELADPKHPISGYDKFMEAVTAEISAAVDLPYEVLIQRFQASFSASKAALQEAWKAFLVYREYMVQHYYRPIYEMWMFEAISKGRIEAPGFFDDPITRTAWLGSSWIGTGQGMIDPLKESKAMETRLKNRITNHQQEKQNYDGGDWRQTAANYAKEEDHLNNLNIHPDSMELKKLEAANQTNGATNEGTITNTNNKEGIK